MTTTSESVLSTSLIDDDKLVVATLNRPAKGNALNNELVSALEVLIEQLRNRRAPFRDVRALVITGAGDRAFSAGADINNLVGLSRDRARDQMIAGQKVFQALETLDLPVIAAINGVAYGGGLELAMACDMRITSSASKLGQPEITLANIPGWGGTQRLPRIVGEGRALEMILTGDPITAARAYEIGLVNAIDDNPLSAAITLAQRISRNAAGAVAAGKKAVYDGLRYGSEHGYQIEAELVGDRCATPEQREAVEAFLQRKKPQESQENQK